MWRVVFHGAGGRRAPGTERDRVYPQRSQTPVPGGRLDMWCALRDRGVRTAEPGPNSARSVCSSVRPGVIGTDRSTLWGCEEEHLGRRDRKGGDDRGNAERVQVHRSTRERGDGEAPEFCRVGGGIETAYERLSNHTEEVV